MASYFRQVPDFDYVNRDSDGRNIGDYTRVKNLFKRVKIREDILQNLAYFTQYKIIGDDRPDNVAFDVYQDETFDWLVLLSNNILNIQTEWPLTQSAFNDFLIKKYKSIANTENIHHYETRELRNDSGDIVTPKGLEVPKNYKIEYFDTRRNQYVVRTNEVDAVTNYTYEVRKEEAKRNIYLLKPQYIELILDDTEKLMTYRKGSTQYVSRTLKRGEDIRLFN
tara:strand:+ start:1479 stop:2147 length:669 start_codon:yes stop_codon:yes gene_type:complete